MSRHKNIVIGVIVIASLLFAFHLGRWIIASSGPSVCDDKQNTVSITPIGHKSSTSYIIVGDRGRSYEYWPDYRDHPPRVGYPFCFESHIEHRKVNFWTLDKQR